APAAAAPPAAAPPAPGAPTAPTPPAQVAVRDVGAQRTRLVSQTRASLGGEPQPVSDGAALVPDPLDQVGWASTAAISADGSTVAWMGIEIPAQAQAGAAEVPAGTTPVRSPRQYAEPLWRRIDDGPAAPTRRVTGGDDPDCGCLGPLATGYAPQGPVADARGPEFGTFVATGGFAGGSAISPSVDSITPQLSADGRRVAFLSTQPDRGREPSTVGRSFATTANAFVADMTPGLTRTAALTRLTDWGGSSFGDLAASGQIADVAISPDGARVAFTTARQSFPHAPPALTSQPVTQAPARAQLYLADLTAGTLELVTRGFDDQPGDAPAATPSFSGDGTTLAFAAAASNLVYGAWNGVSNVFVRTNVTVPTVAGVPQTSAAPAPPRVTPSWRLDADARRGARGAIVLDVAVPAAGSVRASATAAVTTTRLVTMWRRQGRRRVRVKRKRTRVLRRVVARARARSSGAGVVTLTLRPAPAYRAQAARRGGLYATFAVTFAAPGRRPLTRRLQASFPKAAATRAAKRGTG
ncbi:hypothetical protein, partial [Conexibacter sp. CPCC 205762]|uniref:TolB family protein n=1 Tax=Conexibacter sp. CPCC 205762 TaxID=3064573 RepID=UPI00271EF01B